MAKKQFVITIDTETTNSGRVADFAAVISDRKGNIHAQCAVLVRGVYDDPEDTLFTSETSGELWNSKSLQIRNDRYNAMLDSGIRMMASPAAIAAWLHKASKKYNPVLTAYNLAFDLDKCEKTAIDLSMLERRFCLWAAAVTEFGTSKKYRQFILQNHFFKSPTDLGNMSYSTNAETMARFITGNPDMEDEPHTALEDIVDYEIPILNTLWKRKPLSYMIENSKPYNWRNFQVKDWFSVK